MEKPLTFAGQVIHKGRKKTFNDYAQPEKFFADMANCLKLMDEIPFSAIEDLQNYELNRDVMVRLSRRIYKIFRAAGLDICEEIDKQTVDPFEGLEDDIEIQKQKHAIKISGEQNE